jgi:hypothetical protein
MLTRMKDNIVRNKLYLYGILFLVLFAAIIIAYFNFKWIEMKWNRIELIIKKKKKIRIKISFTKK